MILLRLFGEGDENIDICWIERHNISVEVGEKFSLDGVWKQAAECELLSKFLKLWAFEYYKIEIRIEFLLLGASKTSQNGQQFLYFNFTISIWSTLKFSEVFEPEQLLMNG